MKKVMHVFVRKNGNIYFMTKVQFPMSPTKRKSIPVTKYFGGRLNKRTPPTKMAVAMGPSY